MTRNTNKTSKKKKITVANGRCVGCSYCKLNCPADAMVVEDALARPTKNCTRCGTCVWVCPVGAIVQK